MYGKCKPIGEIFELRHPNRHGSIPEKAGERAQNSATEHLNQAGTNR
jgi:hypothetical protein